MISHVATPMLFVAPANRLGPNARTLWIVQGIANYLVVIAFIVGVGFFAPGRFWWWSLAAVVGILAVPYVIARSYLRLRVHRWEFNEVALYVQTGWITHVRTIIPIQRIKKITEQRGLLQEIVAHRIAQSGGIEHRPQHRAPTEGSEQSGDQ